MMIRALASPQPRNFVFRVNAVPKPRMNRNATVTTMYSTVTRAEFQKNSSWNTLT